MKLATFKVDRETEIGVVTDDNRLISISRSAPDLATDLKELIADWPSAKPIVKAIVANPRQTFDLSEVHLSAPITNPGKVMICGFNRPELFAKTGFPVQRYPAWVQKMGSSIADPNSKLLIPERPSAVDGGVYIAVIIGKRGKYIAPENADGHIFGYSIAFAAGERLRQHQGWQWTAGASLDTFAPVGPFVITKDKLPHPEKCRIKGYLNGELRQDIDLSGLTFSISEQISSLSQAMTIHPGDMFFDGSPMSLCHDTGHGRFLRGGDVVRCRIDEIGQFELACEERVKVIA